MEARQHKDRAIAVAGERGIARGVDFDKAGVPRVYLQRLMREGVLQRIGRGLYKLSDAPSGAASSLAEAWRIQPKGVIGLLSALQFHGLTTQTPHAVWMLLEPKDWAPVDGGIAPGAMSEHFRRNDLGWPPPDAALPNAGAASRRRRSPDPYGSEPRPRVMTCHPNVAGLRLTLRLLGTAMNILLVEDDPKTALHVATALEQHAHTVTWAATGADGLSQARTGDHRLFIIDRMLPRLDGLSLLQRLRHEGYAGPALILSAMGDTEDRVEGLEAGADDYLSKPFSISELLARVNALLRRPLTFVDEMRPTRLRVADLEMDLLARTVTRSGRPIDLQDQEFRLLRYMVENAGRVVTRKMLLEHAWDLSFEPRSNILESHMSRIRTKVDRGFPLQLIETIRGVGYQIRSA